MLKIGYVRLCDADSPEEATTLEAAGCHVVRAEEPETDAEGLVLDSVLEFIGAGDQLVVTRLERLAPSSRALLEVLDRLEARGASLCVLDPEFDTGGGAGETLRAVLQAVSQMEPPGGGRRRRPAAAAQEISALRRAGVGPVEIARRLGVSRMTVWRKLKAVEAQA